MKYPLFLAFCSSQLLFAHNDLSLLALLNLKTTKIASGTLSMSENESPGIVSVLDQEDIKRLGAADLNDVLRTIPGIDIANNLQGVVSIGMRGLWANEGKVLVLLDGVQLNEDIYGDVQFGSRVPLAQVRRIEVIRGPGSALYGGYAEFGVINIVTKDPDSYKGLRIHATQGISTPQTSTSPVNAAQSISLGLAQSWHDFSLEANGYLARNLRGDRPWSDLYGAQVNLVDNHILWPRQLNASLRFKTWELYGLFDQYRIDRMDSYTQALNHRLVNQFNTYALGLRGEQELSDNLKFFPTIEWRYYNPWDVPLNSDSLVTGPYGNPYPGTEMAWGYSTQSFNSDLHFGWSLLDDYYVDFGTKAIYSTEDVIKDTARYGQQPVLMAGQDHLDNWDLAAYVQGIWKGPLANITLGGRVEYNSLAQDLSLVPRFAITKEFNKFHVKLLASKAFRPPAFANITTNLNARDSAIQISKRLRSTGSAQDSATALRLDPIASQSALKSENTSVLETEVGYDFNSKFKVSGNLFYLHLDRPIIYTSPALIYNNYYNVDHWGNYGFELQSKYTGTQAHAGLSYSYYRADLSDSMQMLFFGVPQARGVSIGFPSHKISADYSYSHGPWLWGNRAIWTSPRYSVGQATPDQIQDQDTIFTSAASAAIIKLPYSLQLSTHLRWQDPRLKGFYSDVGIDNLLNESYTIAEALNNSHTGMPGLGRTYYLNLGFEFGMN